MNNKKLYFVYGTLLSNLGNNYILRDSKLVGEFTTKPEFTMYDIGFPGVVRGGLTPIKGEVYEVIDEQIEEDLDYLEGVSSGMYSKQTIDTEYGEAYIYIWERGPREIIKNGDYRSHVEESKKKNRILQ